MTKKAPSSLFETISRISYFAYEPIIAKYPFLKEYLKKEKDPRTAWSLWMTAAGAAYVLLTKEAYLGEHNEIIESIENVEGLQNFVKDCANFMSDVYKKNRKFYPHAIGFWIVTRIKGEKPTLEELEGLPQDITKLLNSTIQDYEAKK
jgi:hypothetical protein